MRNEQVVVNAFKDVPQTPAGHFRIVFYAAVYRLINYIRRIHTETGTESLESIFKKYPFLTQYFKEITPYLPAQSDWETLLKWWETQLDTWSDSPLNYFPLQALARQEGLPSSGMVALMLVGLVEEDSRFGTLFAAIQEPLVSRRPCLQLVELIMSDTSGTNYPSGIYTTLLSAGLVNVSNPEAPRSEFVLRIPSILWAMIRGEISQHPASQCDYYNGSDFPLISQLVFPQKFLDPFEQVPILIESGKIQAVLLRGTPGSERLQVAGALARAMNRNLLALDHKGIKEDSSFRDEPNPRLIGPLCTMSKSIPLFTCDLGPGEIVEIPEIKGYSGPCIVLTGFEGGLRGAAVEKSVTLTLPSLEARYRKQCWQALLPQQPQENLDQISQRFHLPGGYIRQVAPMAIAQAALQQRNVIQIDDVRQACRRLNRQLLDTLASYLESEGSWDRLVVNPAIFDKLKELERRCRCREQLYENLGPAFGSVKNTGVRALLTGASGTGKTMAARILAAELGMDLYRVDLAAVINKYIGETEKNLHLVLTRAEELDVILLLDEGDALLGTRTDIKNANDRYANLETDYLLQKLENYQGIVIVTTNAVEKIDSAFQRRMDVVINFIPPQPQERWHIWQLHLPPNHRADSSFLEEVAIRCEITGGQIRNAALHSALLALDQQQQVDSSHIVAALQSEYRKAGALCPLAFSNSPGKEKKQSGIQAFWGALSS